MSSIFRDITAEGIAGIIRALPDEAKVTLLIEDLTRAKFDLLRGAELELYLNRFGSAVWTAEIDFGDGVSLEIETREPPRPALRAVS